MKMATTFDWTFEMNGKAYQTDTETGLLLRSIMKPARETNDFSAVFAIMHFGELTGRIVEVR
jgi:hypothetical protein